jgi:hypothetical protein
LNVFHDFHYSKFFHVGDLPSVQSTMGWLARGDKKPENVNVYEEVKFEKRKLERALLETYNFYGCRIPFLERSLLFFPEYMVYYQRTFKSIMTREEAIPFEWRLYLGLLVTNPKAF